MSHQHHCTNCGAVMTPQADGRIHACQYCGAKLQVAVGSEQIAAGLKLDLANVEAFLHNLAHELHQSFGDRSRLHVESNRLILFELNLDPDMFVAKREGHHLVAQHRKMVRGIALKTATHPVDHWVELLAKALAHHANENARVAQVLAQLRSE